MKRRYLFIIPLLIVVFLFNTCQRLSQIKEGKCNTALPASPKDSATYAIEKLNDVARYIAGLPIDNSSAIYNFTQNPEWDNYSSESSTAWKRFNTVAAKYKTFSKAEIPPPYDTIKTLFYPFSGPDFLFANIMFPNVEKMILIGLESPGSVPAIDSTLKDSLKQVLELYKVSIEDVIRLSFFRTIDMKNELGNKTIDGITPIIILFMARSDKIITEVNKMYLDNKGILRKAEGKQTASAVEILYHDNDNNKIKKVIYLSTNLADPALSKNIPFLKFLKNIDNSVVTYLKSASYLMHKSYFSIIRNTCFKKSLLILQDDSGIAYRYFNKEKWNIKLYGSYTKPIKLFEDSFEPDYFEAFKNSNPKPLNFRSGYDQKSNLLIAIKK